MKNKKELEIRTSKIDNIETDTRTVTGYAIVFDSESEDLGFIETIKPSAVTLDVINKSDVFCKFNHQDDKILARSKYGVGSLSLELDGKGLKYTFEAPKTTIGDELLEHIRRGDIDSSSFAFVVSKDKDSEVWYNKDGVQHRDIFKIEYLADVSPVWNPAYSATSLSARALEQLEKLNNSNVMDQEKEKIEDQELKEQEQLEEVEEKGETEETVPQEEQEEQEREGTETEDSQEEENKEEVVENNKRNNKRTKTMKNFSLINAIRSASENRSFDEVTTSVVAAGIKEMRKAGISAGGQIVLPFEKRAAVTVTGEGVDVVGTDLFDIAEPLRAKNVLLAAGAKFYTGLVNNVQIPVMTGSNVGWAGETAEATDGNPSFANVRLTPKRLTAYVDISKALLIQDSVGVEQNIRQDLINAINSKLEATILGKEAGTADKPAGVFNGKTPTKVTDFEGLVNLEALVEEKNVISPIAYIASPSARASFRNMMKGSRGTAIMAYANDQLDGTPVYSTSNVEAKRFVVGDWSNYVIGQFGGIDITVDPYTKASAGQVRLIVNCYFDAAPLRPEVFQYGTFATV